LLVLGTVTISAGCLVPPTAPLLPPNHAPEINLESVTPASPIITVSKDCPGFDVRGVISDRDDDPLRYRLISDNRIENNVRGIKEVELLAGTRAGRPFDEGINLGRHFRFNPNLQSAEAHTLSLVVTDAPGWSVRLHDETAVDRAVVALGANDAGVSQYGVVEYRWLVNIVPESGLCP